MTAIRIEISGGIATGKTTLAGLFENEWAVTLFEDFTANPFLKHFYVEPERFAFETEITFLLQHYNQIKRSPDNSGGLVLDTSLVLDLAYADVNLEDTFRDAFDAVFMTIMNEVAYPDLLILLTCSAEMELQRIRARGRSEENAIDVSYLTAINEAVERRAREFSASTDLMVIESDKVDFANDEQVRTELATSILSKLQS